MRQLDLSSKEGGFGRTGARTPMQWTTGRNAGFSTAPASELYLPLDPAKDRSTVEKQDGDPRSLLNHIRRLSKLRLKTPALQADGAFTPVFAKAKKYPFVYKRSGADSEILVALNPSRNAVKISLDLSLAQEPETLLARGATLRAGKKAVLEMKGVSYGIFHLK